MKCQGDAETAVREMLDTPSYDVALVHLDTPLPAPPVALATSLPGPGDALQYLGPDGRWQNTHVANQAAPDFTVLRHDLSDRMTFLFTQSSRGPELIGLSSRPAAFFKPPRAGVSEMVVTSVSEHRGWLNYAVAK